MSDRHWSDDELVARIFGLGPEDAHLDTCELCSRRWDSIRRRHEARRAMETDVPEAVLAGQRRAIYARLDRRPRMFRLHLMPSLATVLLVLVILTVFKPAPRPPADTVSDEKVFEDVFKLASSTEASSIAPVRSLFEVQP